MLFIQQMQLFLGSNCVLGKDAQNVNKQKAH